MVPDKVERLCRRAQQAIAERDWDKAKQGYLMALAMRSDLPDVHYGLATVYFQQRELTSAAHHFREVTRLEPNRAGAHINLGAVLNLLNQYDEAIAALRRGIQLDPQRVEGYYNLGLVYRRKGQADLAITAYREAIRLNPRMADAHLNLANLYLERENARMALNHYQQAAQLRPNWDKALEGIEQAKAILEDTQPASPAQSPAQPAAASVIESAQFRERCRGHRSAASEDRRRRNRSRFEGTLLCVDAHSWVAVGARQLFEQVRDRSGTLAFRAGGSQAVDDQD